MSSTDPLLVAEDVHAGYGSKEALRGVSLSVFPGQVVGLLGPNGSGKTTMLKVLCGALPVRSGTVTSLGQPMADLSSQERAKRIAYVPQSEDHAFDFTIRELTLMGRFAHGDGIFETASDRRVAEAAMRASDCLELADRQVSTLSGGEAQRALIARALAQESPVLLCDEPTTHLDPKHQIEVAHLIRKLAQDGKGIVVTTHDLNMATACCDRVVLLRAGECTFEGPLEKATLPHLHSAFDVPFAEHEGHIWPTQL